MTLGLPAAGSGELDDEGQAADPAVLERLETFRSQPHDET
jgi:hypothetical protein